MILRLNLLEQSSGNRVLRGVKLFALRNIFLIIFITLISYEVSAKKIQINKIVNLNLPWGMTFLNENEVLVTEKKGKIRLINFSTLSIKDIKHNLNIISRGQGGLLDIIYKDEKVWVSYSENRGSSKTSTSIAKADFDKDEMIFKNIFQANTPINSGYHFGSRLVIAGNYLFASVGERGRGMIAQDATKHPGSIIRIYLDGSITEDNQKYMGYEEL